MVPIDSENVFTWESLDCGLAKGIDLAIGKTFDNRKRDENMR